MFPPFGWFILQVSSSIGAMIVTYYFLKYIIPEIKKAKEEIKAERRNKI